MLGRLLLVWVLASAKGWGQGSGSGSHRSGDEGSGKPLSLEQRWRACLSSAMSLAERCVQANLRGVAPERSWRDWSGGPSVENLLPRKLTYPYVMISSPIIPSLPISDCHVAVKRHINIVMPSHHHFSIYPLLYLENSLPFFVP